jgi:hypothetical protein
MKKKISFIFFTVPAFLVVRAAQWWACAVCLGGSGDGVADGYNASVLFLMSTPYMVFGAIVGGLILSYRRTRRRREQAEDGDSTMNLAWKQEESGR